MRATLTRRGFLSGAVGTVALAARSVAQEVPADTAHGPTMSGPMDENLYKPVRLPPKTGGAAPLTQDQRDDIEHSLKCQCNCPLDVYVCRTTDFTCPVSPAMHRDVVTLASTGYDGGEILLAFQAVYGERVLTAPLKQGFNLVGWGLPFVVIAGAGLAVFRWARKRSSFVASNATTPVGGAASEDELSRIEAAVRNDE